MADMVMIVFGRWQGGDAAQGRRLGRAQASTGASELRGDGACCLCTFVNVTMLSRAQSNGIKINLKCFGASSRPISTTSSAIHSEAYSLITLELIALIVVEIGQLQVPKHCRVTFY